MPITRDELIQFVKSHSQAPNYLQNNIILNSVPVYWFGDINARVATVGINPGPAEFASNHAQGQWGARNNFRVDQPYTDTQIEVIVDWYLNYFNNELPGGRFWTRLDNTLSEGGFSYRHQDPTYKAFHVDIIPWGTDPIWGKLDQDNHDRLLTHSQAARDLLFSKLQSKVFICRGSTATKVFGRARGFFNGEPEWRPLIDRGRYICHHQANGKHLIGIKAWYYDKENTDETIGDLIRHILGEGSPYPLEECQSLNKGDKVVQPPSSADLILDVNPSLLVQRELQRALHAMGFKTNNHKAQVSRLYRLDKWSHSDLPNTIRGYLYLHISVKNNKVHAFLELRNERGFTDADYDDLDRYITGCARNGKYIKILEFYRQDIQKDRIGDQISEVIEAIDEGFNELRDVAELEQAQLLKNKLYGRHKL